MKRRDRDAGQAMVEYALTAAIFFTLVIFILDGSRVLWGYVTVSQAAAAGARYGITHGSAATQPVGPGNYVALQQVVAANAHGLDPAQLTTTAVWASNSNARGSRITVEVTYRTEGLAGFFWAGQTFNLVGRSSMIIQN
jgi:Flp pilus assembly protein TadG